MRNQEQLQPLIVILDYESFNYDRVRFLEFNIEYLTKAREYCANNGYHFDIIVTSLPKKGEESENIPNNLRKLIEESRTHNKHSQEDLKYLEHVCKNKTVFYIGNSSNWVKVFSQLVGKVSSFSVDDNNSFRKRFGARLKSITNGLFDPDTWTWRSGELSKEAGEKSIDRQLRGSMLDSRVAQLDKDREDWRRKQNGPPINLKEVEDERRKREKQKNRFTKLCCCLWSRPVVSNADGYDPSEPMLPKGPPSHTT